MAEKQTSTYADVLQRRHNEREELRAKLKARVDEFINEELPRKQRVNSEPWIQPPRQAIDTLRFIAFLLKDADEGLEEIVGQEVLGIDLYPSEPHSQGFTGQHQLLTISGSKASAVEAGREFFADLQDINALDKDYPAETVRLALAFVFQFMASGGPSNATLMLTHLRESFNETRFRHSPPLLKVNRARKKNPELSRKIFDAKMAIASLVEYRIKRDEMSKEQTYEHLNRVRGITQDSIEQWIARCAGLERRTLKFELVRATTAGVMARLIVDNEHIPDRVSPEDLKRLAGLDARYCDDMYASLMDSVTKARSSQSTT